jgi:uncharacterized DUF497 family protein
VNGSSPIPISRFEWDEAKSQRCRQERGFAFADILPAFVDPDRRIEPDLHHSFGEDRFRLFGRVEGRLFAIVYTIRGKAARIISARKANAREQRRYGKGPGAA